MNKYISVSQEYLYIPVKPGFDKKVFHLYAVKGQEWEKIMDFRMPVDMAAGVYYGESFMAEIPVRDYMDQTLVIEGEAPESFFACISNLPKTKNKEEKHPVIHFAAETGWINDPNGLVYQDGTFHAYFQYNPWDINWDNMSWGHAESKDLMHWEQKDTVMFPDADGTIFSGSAIVNKKGCMSLPNDALIYFYTAAGSTNEWSTGKEFTQKIAYSTDGGRTLHKVEHSAVDTIFYDNRDPKVFWHEESQAYVMVLWLRGAQYAIFRSENLTDWVESQRLELPDTWECPDLFCLKNGEGKSLWFFWTADGYYFPGYFDGYRFASFLERGKAYVNSLPYAAQTYSGLDDRVVSIPWIRMENDGRNFTGMYGTPVELSYEKEQGKHVLIQRPAREILQAAKPISEHYIIDENGKISYNNIDKQTALLVKMVLNQEYKNEYRWLLNDTKVTYSAVSGMVMLEPDKFLAGYDFYDVMMLIDDKLLEIYFDGGRRVATFILDHSEVSFSVEKALYSSIEMYTIS